MSRVAVLGAGGNGSSAAADLIAAGEHDVVVIDQWPAHVEAMREHGLRITMPDRELTVPVPALHLCDVQALQEPFDIVFLAVKAYDTRWMCELIRPHLKPDGLLVGLQNGMTVADVVDIVGSDRTVGCVVELSSELFTPGHVKRNTPPEKTWFALGSPDGATEARLPEVAAVLGAVGTVTISSDILSAKWTKLVVNTMGLGPDGIVGLDSTASSELSDMRDLVQRIGDEAIAVGERSGYVLQPLFGLRPEDLGGPDQVRDRLLGKLTGDLHGLGARSCVLQDHLKGRYSEVDAINGLVAQLGQEYDVSTPANAALVELSRRIFEGELKPDRSNLELARQLLAEED
jgi:2-dehydropantoate 2-reductase